MKLVKAAVLVGGALIATPAFAQDPDPAAGGTVEAGASGEVVADPNAPALDGTANVDATVTGAVALTWSRSVIDRPYVLGTGKIGAYGGYSIAQFSFTNPLDPTMSTTVTGDGFGVGGGYGITDKITAGAQYGFTPGLIGDADGDIAGELALYGEFQLVHDGKLSITASADVALDFSGEETTKDIHAGLGARYNLAPTMAVFTGAPYGPGPVGQHLRISLDTDGPITFDVPVGFMFQATPELNLHLATSLANISISNSETVVFGADYIPLSLGALYSVTPNIDVTGMFILPDVKEIGFDLYAFQVGARWYN